VEERPDVPLSPAEVRDVVFSQPPVGEPGFHEDEVGEFVDLVHAELTRLVEENDALRDQVEQLDQQLRAASGGTGHHHGPRRSGRSVMTRIRSLIGNQSRPRDGEDEPQLSMVLACAQHRADQITTQAHAEADRTLDQAQADCAHLISEAHHKAEDMVNNATIRVETMLGEARSTAEALYRQSREKTASLEQDAARTHAETLVVFHHDKTLLEHTMDDLRGFEREYRRQLTLYLQSLLHELDGPTPTTPVDPIHPGRDLVSVGEVGKGACGDTKQSPPG
jgi:DivIVA domain-containing protein